MPNGTNRNENRPPIVSGFIMPSYSHADDHLPITSEYSQFLQGEDLKFEQFLKLRAEGINADSAMQIAYRVTEDGK